MPFGATAAHTASNNNDFQQLIRTQNRPPRAVSWAPSEAKGCLQVTQESRDRNRNPYGPGGGMRSQPGAWGADYLNKRKNINVR